MTFKEPPLPELPQSKILIVDDHEENLVATEIALRPLNADVFTAPSGNEALKLMVHHDFAVVLLDVQMPGMDGFEVADIMHDDESTRNTPIIFVTAISKEQRYIFKGYETGAVDYLFKPVEPEILRGKADVFCRLYRQRQVIQHQHDILAQKLAEIKTLRELLPICSSCKKIRDEDGYWQQIERYFEQHTDASFSHGICESCMKKSYPEAYANLVKKQLIEPVLGDSKDNIL